MSDQYSIILFYQYVPIEEPNKFMEEQRVLCERLILKGRVIIATEGVNATLEGKPENIERYIKIMQKDKRFKNTHFKKSTGNGQSFPKLKVKVRPELVAYDLAEKDVDPLQTTGRYITAEELHDWINSKKEFLIVDMRNDYEQEVGHFQNSIFSGMKTSRDLPNVLPQLLLHKNQIIVTVCTGGIRCEKASGFLIKHGFKNVYQLYGGIVTYMEKYPNEDFLGSLYVFDDRLVIGFNMDDPQHVVVGKCANCQKPSENFANCLDNFCNRQFIICAQCSKGEKILCPMGCRDYRSEHPERFTEI